MISLIKKTGGGGVEYWTLPSWEEQGVVHGFVGAGIDLKRGRAVWQEQFGVLLGSCDAGLKRRLYLLQQVHGNEIKTVLSLSDLVALEALESSSEEGGLPVADGWMVDYSIAVSRGCCFGIKTADCIPVLLYSPCCGLIGALHCGWRGVAAGLLTKGIAEMIKLGSVESDIQVGFGAGAGACCYKVSRETAEVLWDREGEFGSSFDTDRASDEVLVDLRGILKKQALKIGVLEGNIVSSHHCTICDHRFFSHRRQKILSGRQLSFIGG